MFEMCIYSFFASFSNSISKKKLLYLLLFSQGLFVYVFSIPVPIFIKKNTHIPFFVYAQKIQFCCPGWSVGRFPCMFVCWLDLCWAIWLVLF